MVITHAKEVTEMKTLIVPGMAVAAALAIGACGGGSSSTISNAAAPAASAATVSVHQLSGVGRVLVDRSGKPIYTPDQEADGRILCGSGCTAFWKPVTAAGKPTAAPSAGKLGVIKRPDGGMQVTDNGRPLYTFSEDSPGKATGDGFKDAFSGHHFTWHVVRAGGTTTRGGASSAPAYTTPSSGGNGY
jgi:predicted lipoprotein with Yx(FWY)xxD motif